MTGGGQWKGRSGRARENSRSLPRDTLLLLRLLDEKKPTFRHPSSDFWTRRSPPADTRLHFLKKLSFFVLFFSFFTFFGEDGRDVVGGEDGEGERGVGCGGVRGEEEVYLGESFFFSDFATRRSLPWGYPSAFRTEVGTQEVCRT